MKKSEIAQMAEVSDTFVLRILSGKRSPFTAKGVIVLNFAAQLYADECRIAYVKKIVRSYKLNKTLEKRKKNGEEKGRK